MPTREAPGCRPAALRELWKDRAPDDGPFADDERPDVRSGRLRESHAGDPRDIGMVRTITWQYEQYIPIGAALGSSASAEKWNHLFMVQRTDSEIKVIQLELKLAGIALTPPDDWKQTVNGKQVEPLDDVLDQSL